MTELAYLRGFDATHQTEALDGALPPDQNSPRRAPYGLYPEQLNGTPFTVPREENRRCWLYRIRPSVIHGELEPLAPGRFGATYLEQPVDPNLLAWRPRPVASPDVDFLDGLVTVGGAGDPARGEAGLSFHTFAAGRDMTDRGLQSSDGDLLLLPDSGTLHLQTEHGHLAVGPGELAVVPRGVVFRVALADGPIRGFAFEIVGRHFRLPERGPIGANGLADARHFRYPVAAYEDREVAGGFELVVKLGGTLWTARRSHSPFDVVAWHGNYAPYAYDLSLFNAMGTVTWDHPDPSIFTVLSAPLDRPGENLADLVVFPNPRWDVAEHTFRPPFFHRNAASEINAIVKGPSAPDRVFTRGGYFVTPVLTAHGVAAESVERHLEMTDEEADRPTRVSGSALWLQVESALPLRFARSALEAPTRDRSFRTFASGVPSRFEPNRPRG